MQIKYRTGRNAIRKIMKALAFTIIIIAAIAIFLYTLIVSVLLDNPIAADQVALPAFWPLVGSAVIFLVHLTYLLTVGWDQLFKYPHDRMEAREAILILLLGLTYLVPITVMFIPFDRVIGAPGGGGLIDTQIAISKVLATALFATLYSWWALIDWHELQQLRFAYDKQPNEFIVFFRQIFSKCVTSLRRLWRSTAANTDSEQTSVASPVRPTSSGPDTGHREGHAANVATNNLVAVQKSMWMGLDLFLATALWLSLYLYEWFNEPSLYKLAIFDHFTIKEIAVVIALVARAFSLWLVRLAFASDELIKHRGWQNALNRRAREFPWRSGHGSELAPILQPKFAQRCSVWISCEAHPPNGAAAETANHCPLLKCLVVNCGTGTRTAQVLRRLKVRGTQLSGADNDYRVHLLAYHHDDNVGDTFRAGSWVTDRLEQPEKILSRQFTSDLDQAMAWAADVDVIVVLHSTYDRHEAHRVESIVSKAKPNTVVLVRGFADHSILATVCYQHPDRGLTPVPHYHRWNHGFLREIASHLSWRIITPYGDHTVRPPDTPPNPKAVDGFYPIKIIEQSLFLDQSSIVSAMSYMATQISEVACNGMHEQLAAIASATPVAYKANNVLANADDYIYCFLTPIAENSYDHDRVTLEYSERVSNTRSRSAWVGSSGHMDTADSPQEVDRNNPAEPSAG